MRAGDRDESRSEERRNAAVRSAAGAFLVAGLMVAALLHPEHTPSISLLQPSARRLVPPFSLPLLSGATWRLEDHRGRVVLLNVWATWCGPCRRELPVLSAMAREEESRGLDVIGIDVDAKDRRQATEAFLRSSPVSYAVAVPERMPGIGPPVEEVPMTLLLDREGRVAAILVGAFEEKSLRGAVGQLLRER